MAQQNASTMQETLRPAQRQAQKGVQATKDFFSERSTLQIVLMILIPVLLISAVAGYFVYRNKSAAGKRRRAVKKAAIARPAPAPGLRRGRRRRVGRRVGGRARGRRTRTTRVRGRGVTTPGQATP